MKVIVITTADKVKGECEICGIEYKMKSSGKAETRNYTMKCRVLPEYIEEEEEIIHVNEINRGDVEIVPAELLCYLAELWQLTKELGKKMDTGEEISKINICLQCKTTIECDLLNFDLKKEKRIVEKKIEIKGWWGDIPPEKVSKRIIAYKCVESRTAVKSAKKI